MKFVSHTPQNCYLVIWGGVEGEGEGEGGATLLYCRGSTSSMCHFLIPMDCLQPWTCTVYGLRRYILRCVPIAMSL